MFDLKSARHWAEELQREAIGEGMAVIDATMGNGGDTERLCQLGGETGRVYAFDVQAQAVENTRARLTEAGMIGRAQLNLAGHERVLEFVHEPVDAVVFNLGWLPGGDKSVTTLWETTKTAVTAALSLLEKGGVVTICAYPGHAAGDYERAQLMEFLSALRPQEYNVLHHRFLNAGPGAPECFIIQRQ